MEKERNDGHKLKKSSANRDIKELLDHSIGKFGKMKFIMLKFKYFTIYSILFSIGFFGGEWIFDLVFNDARNHINKEVLESLFVGITTAAFWVFWSKSYPKKKSKRK